MSLVVDTSVIIAVISNEEHRDRLVQLTKGKELLAPASLHWEIGNAFSAMFKRKQVTLSEAIVALKYYYNIPIRLCEIELKLAVEMSHRLGIYAYDAYFIACATKFNAPLLSLDRGLLAAAKRCSVKTMEVTK